MEGMQVAEGIVEDPAFFVARLSRFKRSESGVGLRLLS